MMPTNYETTPARIDQECYYTKWPYALIYFKVHCRKKDTKAVKSIKMNQWHRHADISNKESKPVIWMI